MSYSYHTLRDAGLMDAFVEKAAGAWGHTYIGDFPSFRIDRLLHGPELEAYDFRTLPEELSDHRAINALLVPVREVSEPSLTRRRSNWFMGSACRPSTPLRTKTHHLRVQEEDRRCAHLQGESSCS